MMGKERKTERKTRKTLMGLCFFLWQGWTRETCRRGGGGGVGTAAEEDDGVVEALGEGIGLRSPID